MTDERETTATMWQDRHSGKRGHQLMTEKLAETIPALYTNENVADYDTVLAPAKLFSPYSNWTWYITEMDPATGTCFGLVDGLEKEIGYFDLTELAETAVFGGVPAVERDLYWEPKTLGDIKRGSREGSPHNAEIREGDTMYDDTGTESHSPDVVSAEEFLFGGVTEEAVDDAPAAVAGEVPAGGATEDVAAVAEGEGLEPETRVVDDGADEAAVGIAGEQDADGEYAEESDAAGERRVPAETQASQELKVVVSIRGNRATIGVQRPSADPHIESFDDPDLFGLADEFPAVVARARAKWEEEPRYSAYEKPAPPARQRNRRPQGTAQAATTDGEAEAEQPQPETLRLF
ncbi:MAG: DUF2958 domain-containing protein [Chloroflexi bacterium]|nr:DUF2958 domain-containing protein [Chloroflexota bacterium]